MITYPWTKENIKFLPNLERAEPLFQDHSAMKESKVCWRRYFYRMVLGRVAPKEKNQIVFDFGTTGHKFKELLYTQDPTEAFSYIVDPTRAILTEVDEKHPYSHYNRLTLVNMCKRVFEVFKEEKKLGRIKVLAVEQPFNCRLGDSDIYISGRADQIIEKEGKIYDRDWKFTGKQQTYFERSTDPNDQATRYIYGLGQFQGYPINGVYFDCTWIKAPTKKDPAPDVEFYSILTQRTQPQLIEWERKEIHRNEYLKMNREKDIWPMEEEYHCNFCPYAKVCRLTNERAMEAELKSNFVFKPWDSTKVEQEEG